MEALIYIHISHQGISGLIYVQEPLLQVLPLKEWPRRPFCYRPKSGVPDALTPGLLLIFPSLHPFPSTTRHYSHPTPTPTFLICNSAFRFPFLFSLFLGPSTHSISQIYQPVKSRAQTLRRCPATAGHPSPSQKIGRFRAGPCLLGGSSLIDQRRVEPQPFVRERPGRGQVVA